MLRFMLTALASLFVIATSTGGAEAPPDGWTFSSPRDEISPTARVERGEGGTYTLILDGRGEKSVDGKWCRRVGVSEGKFVLFSAQYRARDVESPARSILASILWLDRDGKQVEQAEFPLTRPEPDAEGWVHLTGTYRVPARATEAQLQLHLRWAPKGQVAWRGGTLAETAPPQTRRVKVVSVNHRPRGTRSARESLQQFEKFIDEAGKVSADIVCLPEGTTVCGTGLTYVQVAEAIPGPSTEFLGAWAARNRLHIVAGIYERDGRAVYNTSVLIGRDGRLLGKYRKVCLPREEIDAGITPGEDYPVFDTDFGRIGMMICWDLSYPEVARHLSARGAEILFMPIWGGNETLARARAIENQVYLVASGYDFPTTIYDKAGQPVARRVEGSGVIEAEFDLNERLLWPWLGDWRARIWREAPAK